MFNQHKLVKLWTLKLRASEARFNNIVSISTDGIVIVDGYGVILFVNPTAESLFGRKAEKLLGEQFGFPVVADETTELDIANKDGKPTIAEMRVVVTEWEGEPAYLATLHDITAHKRAEEVIEKLNVDLLTRAVELGDANQELEAFNYTVAHDLRQPLNLLSSYCQVIEKMYGDQLPEECKGYISDAYNVTLRMNSLIEALLNFSRMGHIEPHRETVDLSMVAREVASSLKLPEPERQVDFRIAAGIVANGDANLLRAVLGNLLGNAWKYTGIREKAVIEFGVRDINGVPTYFVRDNGPGFDMTDANKLFAPFQRLPGAENSRGFGIGLATVARIIRRHGGKVWAEGESDKGACFYFILSEN